MRSAYRALAGLFVAGAVVQFFLAGLGVFVAGTIFEVHAMVGAILATISVAMLILAGVMVFGGDRDWRSAAPAALLVLLMVVQYSLVELFSEAAPALAALHPVNGLLVLSVACAIAFDLQCPPREPELDQARA